VVILAKLYFIVVSL